MIPIAKRKTVALKMIEVTYAPEEIIFLSN